ncbi:hypothetical protein CW745_08780 [Psychromonas sp. psych-6C06]|uniref:tetratricopeptide repeat protein n=1 Tax=Psychromonas sp. psych-6C06 TaxID=2058089 RepID=UPI000C32785D|nr:tetratricopeptide repeat protein [Psychromonas sp. psych-6C06]PKF61422.1 hypothetical protein CW745_08780 [Psychromonas sp. psych-6C06]
MTLQFTKKKTVTAILMATTLLLSACSEPTEAPTASLSQYTQQGTTYLEQHQFKAAMVAAKNAITTYPDQIDGYLILAQIYLQLGQPEASSYVLKNYQNEKNADYYFLLLESYNKDNKLFSANSVIETYADILQQQPNRLKLEQAKFLLRDKQIDKAAKLFNQLQSTDAYQSDALVGLARVSALSNDPQGAIALLNNAIENNSKNSEALILKSYLQINNNDLPQAEKTLSEALAVIPSSDIFTPERINILQALTEVLTMQGRSSEALLYSRILADEFPEAASINQNIIEATKQYQNKEFTLAKQTLDSILKVAPGNKKALTLYGVILYAEGDLKGAQQYLNGIVDPEKDSDKLTQLYAMTQLKLDNASDVLLMLDNTISVEDSYETLTLYHLAAINQQQFEKAEMALKRIGKLFPNSDKYALLSANYDSQKKPAQHEKALATLKKALTKNPENIHLQTAYLQKLILLKRESEADSYIQQLKSMDVSPIDTQLLVAKYTLYRQQYPQAAQLFNSVLAQEEDNLVALYGLAQSKQQTESWSEAQQVYRQAILFHPEELRAYQGVVFNQIQLNQDIEQVQQMLPSNHHASTLALVLADAQFQAQNITQAIVHLEDAKQGVDGKLITYFNQLRQKINYQRAYSALQAKDYIQARTLALNELKSAPEQATFLVLLARIEIDAGQLNEAQKVIQQVEAILPNNPITTIYLADIAIMQKDNAKAIQLLENKWKSGRNDQVAQKLYATLKRESEQRASQFLTQWQAQSPGSLAASINQALVAQAAGDHKQALILYEKVLEQQPNELTSLNNAAWLYLNVDASRAEELARRASQQAPNNGPIADTYGWILYKQGKLKEAQKELRRAYTLAPDNTEIKDHWLEVKDL